DGHIKAPAGIRHRACSRVISGERHCAAVVLAEDKRGEEYRSKNRQPDLTHVSLLCLRLTSLQLYRAKCRDRAGGPGRVASTARTKSSGEHYCEPNVVMVP